MLLNRLVNVNGVKSRNVKAGQPHINDNRNLEIGLDILKLTVKLLAVLFSSEHIEKLRFIVLVTGHNHTNFLNRFKLFLVLFGQLYAIGTDFLLSPFGAKLNNELVEVVCNIAVRTDKHSLACNGSTLCYTGLIMVDEILCDSSQSIGVANDNFHIGNRFLAFLNLMLVRAFFGTTGIVVLNLLDFRLVKRYTSRTTVINEIDSNAITDSFGHSVGIYDLTKDFDCCINRSSGKANVCSVRERIVQILCKAVSAFHACIGYLDFLLQIDLASVSFVRNANDIRPVS